MSWSTPKTNWSTDDGIATTDLNRMEENARIAGLTLGHGVAPESISSAANLDITITNNTFIVSGATQIDYIKTTGRASGATIFLIFSSNPIIKSGQTSAPTGYAKIVSYQNDLIVQANEVLMLLYDGTQWRPVGTNVFYTP
jgi:hypothetical protein